MTVGRRWYIVSGSPPTACGDLRFASSAGVYPLLIRNRIPRKGLRFATQDTLWNPDGSGFRGPKSRKSFGFHGAGGLRFATTLRYDAMRQVIQWASVAFGSGFAEVLA